MAIIDPFDDVKTRPKIVDPFDTPAAPPPTPRGGTGGIWDKTKRLAGSVYGPVADAAADVMRGVGVIGDDYARGQAAMGAATGYQTDALGNTILVPAAERPELKRLVDQGTPIVSPVMAPAVARVRASGRAALPQNPDLTEKVVQGAAGFAAPLATGPLAPLTFGAQAVGKTYDEALAKGATEDVARRAAYGSGAVNTALGMIPGEKIAGRLLAPATKKLGQSVIGRTVTGVVNRAVGGAAVGGGMQTGENVVAQQTYDPDRSTGEGVVQAAASMAIAAPVMHAVLSSPGGMKALRSWWINRGGRADEVPAPQDLPPEALAEVANDPAVQAILQANGIAPGVQAPQGGPARPARVDAQGRPIVNPPDVVAAKLQQRDAQARAGTIAQTASAARAEEQAANSALNAAKTQQDLSAARERLQQATAAREAADAELAKLADAVGANEPNRPTPLSATTGPADAGIEKLRQGMQATTRAAPGDSGYVDPSTLPVADRPQPPPVAVTPPPAAPPAEGFTPAVELGQPPPPTGTVVGRDLRRPSNLPVPAGPSPIPPRMSEAEIAQAQRQAEPPQAQPETPARYVAPEGRQPQTADQLAEQRQAAEAFALRERQRARVAGGIRDVQPGVTTPEGAVRGDRQMGTERGPQPQTVLLDEGFPVRVVDYGPRGTVKVERYDPRTGQAEDGAEPYFTRQKALKQGTYTPEPRRAQDFGARDNPERMSPERERMAGPGRPQREPTQTYRTTEADPNTDFPGAAPEGRSPFPPQPEGPGPFRDQPSGERAQRAWNEEDLRRQEERRQRENAQDDKERADNARARSRSGGAGKSTEQPKGQDEEGRWFTDEDGYVMSSGGGPIVFNDHKAAARWIIDEGQRKSPDQIFQRAAHPTKRTSTGGRFGGTKELVTVVEVGRSKKTAEEEAQPAPGGAGEASGAEGKAAPEAEPQGAPRGLPGPQEAPRAEAAEARQEAPAAEAAETPRPEPKSPEAKAASARSPSQQVADRPLPKKEKGETLDQERERLHEAANILDARLRTSPGGEARKKARAQLDTVIERLKANDAERSKAKDETDPFKDHPEVAAAVKELRSAEKAYDRAKDHHDLSIANKAERRLTKAQEAERRVREAVQKETAPPAEEAKPAPEPEDVHDRATKAWEAVEAHEHVHGGRDGKGPQSDALRAEARRLSDEAERVARKEQREAQKDARFDKAMEHVGPHGDDYAAEVAHLDREMEKYANDKGQSIEAYDSPEAAAKGAHEVLDPIHGKEGVENGLTFKVVRRQGPNGPGSHIWRWEVIGYTPPDIRDGTRKDGEPPPAKAEPATEYTRRNEAWKSEAVAEEAAQHIRDDPGQRGRDVRTVYDRGAWHVEVERTAADRAAEDKRYAEAQEREAKDRAQHTSSVRNRVAKMDAETIDREVTRLENAVKTGFSSKEKSKQEAELRILYGQQEKLQRAEAEPVDVGAGRQEGETAKDAKARVETELDQMIDRARELDAKDEGNAKLRYEMETASGKKTTFTMRADPELWEGLKKRLMGRSTPPSPPQSTATGAKTLKINRFETRQTVTRREALLTGAAAAATVSGTTGNARAAVTPPEARRAFVEGPVGKAIKSGKAQDVLDALAEHATAPTVRWIAKIMQKAGGMGRAKIGTARELEEGVAGITDTSTGEITLRDAADHPHDGMSEEVAAHELIHSFVTARYRSLSTYLTDNLRLLNWTPSKAKGAIDDWLSFHNDVSAAIEREFPGVRKGEGKGLEAFHQQMWSSPDELMSWSLTNKAAQDYLKGLTPKGEKGPGDNMWTRFVDSVAKFFGIYHPRQTALSRALDVSSRIFETGDAPDFKYADALTAKAQETGQLEARRTVDKETPPRPPPGSPTSARGMTPEEVEQFLATPAARRARPQMAKMREDAMTSARAFKQAASDPRRWPEATRQLYDYFASSSTQAMRLIARSKMKLDAKTSQMILDMADHLGTDPGSFRKVAETFERATQGRTGEMVSRARAIIGEDMHDAEFHKRVIDVMRGLTRAAPGSREDRVARALKGLLDDQYVYMRKAGLDPGYVKDGYVPRVYDLAKIQGGERANFLRDAQRVYESQGFTGLHREADGTFKGGTIAEHMAKDWLNRLMGATDSAYGATQSHAEALKGRTLPKSAEAIMKPYMVDDLPAILGDYFHSTSKAAESAKRFGPNGEKISELKSAIALSRDANGKQVFSDKEAFHLGQMIDSSTGHLFANVGRDKPRWADAVSVAGTLAYLPRAAWSSLSEGAAVGVKAHDFTKGVQALADSFRELTPLRQGDDARATSEFLGLVGDVAHDLFMSSRAGIDPQSRLARHVISKFFRANLLTQLTEAQRVAALRVGRSVMRKWISEVATDHPNAKSAQMILNDHGIDRETAVTLHGLLGSRKTFGLGELSAGHEAIDTYKAGLRRFVDESIQNPSLADKPVLANHPWARAMYAIQSFTNSNTKNILAPAFRSAYAGATTPGLSVGDRVRMANPIVALGILSAISAAVSVGRDRVTMNQAASERPELQNYATHFSRANLFGNFDTLANLVLGGARFNRTLTSVMAGPYQSGFAQDAGAIMAAVPNPFDEGSTSISNTAEWNAYKAAYHLIATPLAAAVTSLIPEGSPLVRLGTFGAMQYLTAPQTGNDAADAITGGRTALPKYYR